MEEKHVDQEFLEYLVKSIVDHPDDVTIDRTIDDLGVLLRLKVHKDDMGQVVGRQGATAKAVRSLLRIVGIKHNARVNLKIEEPEGSTHVRPEGPAQPRMGNGGGFVPARNESKPVPKFDGPIADELKL
jgi:predicted RNA-binding protein YlqC (UPF0109 family)